MKHLILVLLITGQSVISFAQSGKAVSSPSINYYGRDYFLLEGTAITDSLKENPYDRMPVSYKTKVREEVWNLSKSSAGISVRFKSNSTTIAVKWTLLHDSHMNHMADTGIKGIDLYYKNDSLWQYINTGRPEGIENEVTLISYMEDKMREYRVYLPLYDGVTNLEVGIDSGSQIIKPAKDLRKPVVFYGTSITQGGCASRPGMAYTNIISRRLDMECINFGFSGNGRMEAPLAELIAGIDASFIVIDCLPNMNIDQVRENTGPLVKIIRNKQPVTPIVFVENVIYEKFFLNQKSMDELKQKNLALHAEYTRLIEEGYQNIFYIDNQGAIGEDHEGTVDGVHFTDLGFLRFSDNLILKFREFKLIN